MALRQDSVPNESQSPPLRNPDSRFRSPSITFAENVHNSGRNRALYVPPPWQRDQGHPIVEVDDELSDCGRQAPDTDHNKTDGHRANQIH
jgi:hypothetical protein